MLLNKYSNVALRFILFFIGLLVSINVYFSSISLPRTLFLIPLVYSVLILSFSGFTKYMLQNIGLLALNVSMFLRYLISPLLISLEGLTYVNAIVPFEENYNLAINLMLYEMLIVFLVFQLFYKNFYSIKQDLKVNIKADRNYFGWVFIFFCLFLVILYPEILSRYTFVLGANELKSKEIDSNIISILPLIVQLGALVLTISLINVFFKKYNNKKSFIYVLISISIVFFISSFIVGTSRFSVVLPLVTGLYIIYLIFNKHKKSISILSIISVIFVVLLTSILKASTINSQNSTIQGFFSDLNNNLQLYFSGLNNVAIAVQTSDIYTNFNFESIMSDITRSVVLINSFFHNEESALTDFNITFYNGGFARDQILPMIGQGYLYFGFILAPIFTVIILLLLMYFDSKTITMNNLFSRFIYAYAALKIGLFMMANFTILLSFLTNNFLVLLLIAMLNNRLKSNKEVLHEH